jgi:nucleoside-diphosphate-sugar epimerase
MKKRILVTGVNGYIGTALAEKLQKKGYQVIGWDTDFFKKTTLGSYKNLYNSKKLDVRQKESDLTDIDCIFHLAALSNDPLGALNEKLTTDINYKATIQLARKAKRAGVKRFIFSSSCSVYGIANENIVDEKSKIFPLTAYARSKVLVEKDLQKLADKNFCVCLLRNATVYGFSPRFRNDLVVNNLVTSALAFGEIRVLSDGTPWRPLVDVRDLCDVLTKFIEVDERKVNGEIFNIGFDQSNYQVRDILQIIKSYLPECKVLYTGEHGKDTRSYRVDFSKLRKLFPKLMQKWPLERSIPDLIKRLNKNNFKRADFEQGKFARLTQLQKLLAENKLDKNLYWNS